MTQTAWREPAVTLGRVEARHSARSLLLWLGVGVAVAATIDGLRGYWPVMPWDAAQAYHHGEILGAFAMLAGARLGLRDRASRTAALVSTAPTGQAKIRAARLGGLAVAAAAAFLLVQAAGIIAAVATGAPAAGIDALLVIDGAAGTVLACWLGYAVGCLGSALTALVAAPAYLAATFLLGHYTTISYLRQSEQWLLPSPPLPDWSAGLGYLPDIFPLHLGYLAGLLLLTGGAIVAWPSSAPGLRPARREPAGRLGRAAAAACIAGLVTAIATGAVLQSLPDGYQVNGPGPAAWIPIYYAKLAGRPRLARSTRMTTGPSPARPGRPCGYVTIPPTVLARRGRR